MMQTIAARYPSQIGSSAKSFVVGAAVLVGTGTVYAIDRFDDWRDQVQHRIGFPIERQHTQTEPASRVDIRTPAQHVENIRIVLELSIADVANYFDVSRQSVYKWLADEAIPEAGKQEKITKLSRIADQFREAGASRVGALVKMKTFDGKSLLDLAKSDVEDVAKLVSTLVLEARAMDDAYVKSDVTSLRGAKSSDWHAAVSIPRTTEHL